MSDRFDHKTVHSVHSVSPSHGLVRVVGGRLSRKLSRRVENRVRCFAHLQISPTSCYRSRLERVAFRYDFRRHRRAILAFSIRIRRYGGPDAGYLEILIDIHSLDLADLLPQAL